VLRDAGSQALDGMLAVLEGQFAVSIAVLEFSMTGYICWRLQSSCGGHAGRNGGGLCGEHVSSLTVAVHLSPRIGQIVWRYAGSQAVDWRATLW
jgi:hypothetical protein